MASRWLVPVSVLSDHCSRTSQKFIAHRTTSFLSRHRSCDGIVSTRIGLGILMTVAVILSGGSTLTELHRLSDDIMLAFTLPGLLVAIAFIPLGGSSLTGRHRSCDSIVLVYSHPGF